MLGLGSSLTTGGAVSSLTPTDISGLDLWLKYNTGIAGASNTTAAGNMSDGEVIHSWADQAENHNAEQGTDNDRPNWVAATNDILFDGDNNHFDLASNVEIDANEDFTVMIRHSFPDFDTGHALIGTAGNEVIKVNNNASVTIKIDDGSVAAVFAEEGGLVFATDVFYIFTLIRSGGSDGYLKAYVNGGAHSDKSWDDAESYQDNPAFTLANIASSADGGLNPDGTMRDVIVWKTALTAGQRADMYSYINAQ
tara:strand:+ start:369 stop:1124 length:756 start_codon:yes stop_codon:yes gene_type:complete